MQLRPPLVLASASPQRRAILERLGVPFTIRPTHVAEIELGEPAEVAVENALRKARAARVTGARETVLGVDTLVALEGRIYGKPTDEARARETLTALSGATHTVFSGVALLDDAHERVAIARTEVSFVRATRVSSTGMWPAASGGGGPAGTRSRASVPCSCARSTGTTRTSWDSRSRLCSISGPGSSDRLSQPGGPV